MTFSSIVFFYEPGESGRPLGWLLGIGRASLVVAGKPGLKPKEAQKALEQLRTYDYGNQLLLFPRIVLVLVLKVSDPWEPLGPGQKGSDGHPGRSRTWMNTSPLPPLPGSPFWLCSLSSSLNE